MSGSKRPPRSSQPSIAYKAREASFDLGDSVFERQVHASAHADKRTQSKVDAEVNTHEILSTTELISAVGQIWDRVSEKSNTCSSGSQNNVVVGDLAEEDVRVLGLKRNGGTYFDVDVKTGGNVTNLWRPKLEFLTITQKMSKFGPCSKNFACPLFKHGWMNGMLRLESPYSVNASKIVDDKKTDKMYNSVSTTSQREGCIPGDATDAGNNIDLKSDDFSSAMFKPKDASLEDLMKMGMKTGTVGSLHFDYFRAYRDSNVIGSASKASRSISFVDYYVKILVPHTNSNGTFQCNADDNIMDNNIRKQHHEYVAEDKNVIDIRSSACEGPCYGVAKQEHAYAGAFSGIFVSLCLHPVDTIKTVSQSYHAGQKSVCDIGRSIVSERGVNGLYRGISSNIASSAPISAIYTFTYESVKGSLLPLFSKEYHSLAHCIAGGSASVATSFVFTPSERIKQQMQIGSRYHNCWSALIGIIGSGGLRSLYTGWTAVLCRNVPHSVIKFYTYESLKQLILPSQKSTAQPSTLQTLFCGGLAGSTAAFFTTPFDVVKTRLQTQIPGSMNQYDSVFHTLKEIGKNEGLKGLYRGLVPRLVMYMSQGALFFTSYEFFKGLFSLRVSQFAAQRIQFKEDDSTPL
ncbi:uncharacterized protein LOC126679179 [Mercurialis annua]|uniref:uncharacterized protein LOC126679179 n=1 Tax=Mercurialis annua TaxID=3986 RepID=UPI00215F5E6C|nr:uncharacterized protein LOC126679179 [Mercurialis annua]